MKLSVLTLMTALLLALFAVPASAQGISAILDRLDSLEKRVDDLGSSVQQEQGTEKGAVEFDFSAYDKSLADLQAQLDDLKKELAAIPQVAASDGIDPEITARIDRLESASKKLEPLLHELQARQDVVEANAAATVAEETVVTVEAEEAESDDLVVSGFVDASYFHDGSTVHGSFGLDQVEVDIEKSIGTTGSVRCDLEWASDGEGGFVPEVEQGFVTYSPAFTGEGTFTFGKFNAPIGFELLDAPDMFQYSHALVFDNGLPTNLTGLMYSAPLGGSWDLSGYVCNGWDVNVDPDKDRTFGGRLGFSGSNWGGGLSAIHGTETAVDVGEIATVADDTVYYEDFSETSSTKLTVFDIDLFFDPTDSWTMGGEINFGSHDLGDETANWWGFLVMSHWDFCSQIGTTIRFDYFDDKDASRLGGEVGETRKAIAVAPTFALGDGMGALFEARWDFSNQEVFTDSDDEPSKSSFALAFEMTYTF